MILNPALIIAEMEAIRKKVKEVDTQALRIIRMVSPEPVRKKKSEGQLIKEKADKAYYLKFNK